MRILVTGRRGMVGTPLVRQLKRHSVIAPDKYELNVGNRNQVMKFKKEKLDCIVHLAAETDHEYCEINPAECYYTNTIGTVNMVDLAKKLDVPIIYASTGSVFDGKHISPYLTDDIPNPLNHYNRSKYYGEIIVRQYLKHFIIRAGWMFGGGPDVDKKFVNKIITKIKNGETKIKVCNDCVGSPTYSVDFADKIRMLIVSRYKFGTYHAPNKSPARRDEFAKSIVSYYKPLNKTVEIVSVTSDEVSAEFPVKRTNYEVLQPSFVTRSWKEALKEYIHAYYKY
jgi:dTDP-4-dehydrorhamnose reductase